MSDFLMWLALAAFAGIVLWSISVNFGHPT